MFLRHLSWAEPSTFASKQSLLLFFETCPLPHIPLVLLGYIFIPFNQKYKYQFKSNSKRDSHKRDFSEAGGGMAPKPVVVQS